MDPIVFHSNEEYLAYEIARLKARVEHYIAAKNGEIGINAYLEHLADQSDRQIDILQARQVAVDQGIPIPFDRIVYNYELSLFEEDLIIAMAAMHLSDVVRQLLIRAQGNMLKPYLEIGFLADLMRPNGNYLTEGEWAEVTSKLEDVGLIYTEAPRDSGIYPSLLGQAVQIPHFLAGAIAGRSIVDNRLARACVLNQATVAPTDVILPHDTRLALEGFLGGFSLKNGHLDPGHGQWRLLVTGAQGTGKTLLVETIAAAFDRPIYRVSLDRLIGSTDAKLEFKLIRDNARFYNAVLHLVRPERFLEGEPRLVGALLRLFSEYQGMSVIEATDAKVLDEAFEALIHFTLAVERPDADEREQLWEAMLRQEIPVDRKINLPELAISYELVGSQIKAAVEWAAQRGSTRRKPKIRQPDLVAGARAQLRSKLDQLTETSKVRLTMEHLILPDDTMNEVNEFLNAARSRARVMYDWGFNKRLVTGKGLAALFAGDAGTGKTLCAEILANELDLKLQIVSIPKVVSKWVGETEKNIREIFSHARAQNSMLLFDEADSLFAKRVKVERAQDHFQNMEVNNLLQEVERFDGIIILTTNLEANIDRAFERRILFKIHFPSPEEDQRLLIWKSLIPKQTPLEPDVDFEFLAEAFELTGGQIKNAIVRAAYHCASKHEGLTQEALERAAQQQASAAGKLARYTSETWGGGGVGAVEDEFDED